MIAILPQNGEKRRFRRQKNLLMEASSYFPMQCIELFVAQRIVVLPLQKRFGRAILGLSTFKNPLFSSLSGLLLCGYKINDFRWDCQIRFSDIVPLSRDRQSMYPPFCFEAIYGQSLRDCSSHHLQLLRKS